MKLKELSEQLSGKSIEERLEINSFIVSGKDNFYNKFWNRRSGNYS